MSLSGAPRTLGVVVMHLPERPVAELPAVRDLIVQVDELVVVANGGDGTVAACPGVRTISFPANRGTAAAWNAALDTAAERGFRYLYIVDQDSVPSDSAVAVAVAVARMDHDRITAVVQPARRDRFGLDPFPWNTVASGSLIDVPIVRRLGGFDERLFVDEVDHELFDRLIRAGFEVRPLDAPTIDHQAGAPRPLRRIGLSGLLSGHSAERRFLQGFSAGILVRRYHRTSPATSARLVLRHLLTAAKDAIGGERGGATAVVRGLSRGLATAAVPPRAASQACPSCSGPLLGHRRDSYRCARCGRVVSAATARASESPRPVAP